MGVGEGHEVIKPLGDGGRGDIEVDTGQKDVARASTEQYHGAVTVAELRDFLGLERLWGVDRSTGVW